MRAVCIDHVTPAEQVTLTELPIPTVRPGWVLLRIRAFGLNHSEQILRLYEIEAPYIAKPIIPGIECVGEIADPSDSSFAIGARVIAMMGGMGRSFHGSYAEYALLPVSHVFSVDSPLPWEELAAIPETYYTAWGSLFTALQLKPSDTLLIRGATCALGYAAIQLAHILGARVIATTHRNSKLPLLHAADTAIVDDGHLAGRGYTIHKALDLVGPKYLRDTLHAMSPGGIVCNTGILGGVYTLQDFDPIKEIPPGVYLTGFYSNYPTQSVIDDLFAFLGAQHPAIGAIYNLDHIQNACIALDEGHVNGKIVVKT